MTRYWHAGDPRLGDDWDAHVRRGSPGGEDFVVAQGTSAYAPDDGYLQFLPASARPNRLYGAAGFDGAGQVLLLTRADGVEFMLFHASSGNGLRLGQGRQASRSELAGESGGARGTPSQGLSTGPHMHEHAVVNGKRVPISSLMGGFSGGGSTPLPKRRRRTMTTHFINTSTLDGTGRATRTTVYAIGGDSPGTPANWQEYTRGDKFERGDDPYPRLADAHGTPVDLNSGEWEARKAAYLSPLRTSGTNTTPDGLATKKDVEDAAAQVIAKIPTRAVLS